MLDENNVLYTLRSVIASWYNGIRTIGIACMLIVLVYIGIRIAISSIAQEKAKYIRILKDWMIAFIMLFFIHYIMIIVIELNEVLVGIFKNNVLSEASLFEQILVRAYDLRLSVGLTATVMYIILVVFTWSYFIAYLKRYFTIAILTVFAPIIAISYAVDKIKDGTSQSFNTWLKEYIFNVLLQTIHALIYSAFISISVKMALEGMAIDSSGQVQGEASVKQIWTSLGNLIPAIVFMITSLRLEKIAREILEFSQAGTQEDTTGETMDDMLGAMYLTKGSRQRLIAPVKTAGKIAAAPFKATGKIVGGAGAIISAKLDWNRTDTEIEQSPNWVERSKSWVDRQKRKITKPIKSVQKQYKAAQVILSNVATWSMPSMAFNLLEIVQEQRDEEDFIKDNIRFFASKNKKGKYDFITKRDEMSDLILKSLFSNDEIVKIRNLQTLYEQSATKFEVQLKKIKDIDALEKEDIAIYAKKASTLQKIKDKELREIAALKVGAETCLQQMADRKVKEVTNQMANNANTTSSYTPYSYSSTTANTMTATQSVAEEVNPKYDSDLRTVVSSVLLVRAQRILSSIVKKNNGRMDDESFLAKCRYYLTKEGKPSEYAQEFEKNARELCKTYLGDEDKWKEIMNSKLLEKYRILYN